MKVELIAGTYGSICNLMVSVISLLLKTVIKVCRTQYAVRNMSHV
jgi:hypothetical protein